VEKRGEKEGIKNDGTREYSEVWRLQTLRNNAQVLQSCPTGVSRAGSDGAFSATGYIKSSIAALQLVAKKQAQKLCFCACLHVFKR
jgi:hypothetical protein